MTQTHGYWQNGDVITVFFSDYEDVATYSGQDCEFYIRMPWADELELEGMFFPHFIANGTMKNNVPALTNVIIPEDRLEFLNDIDSYNIRYPYADLYEKMSDLHHDFGIEPDNED
jgi:hypothetical protein